MGRLFDELPLRYNNQNNKNRYNIIKSIEESLDEYSSMVTDSKNQYFFSTSSGTYLLRLAISYGFDFENHLIYNTKLLRRVAPLISYQPQQIGNTLWEVLKAFYGDTYTKTSVESVKGNYSLDNKELIVETDTRETIAFSGFRDPSNVTPDEVVQFINANTQTVRAYTNKYDGYKTVLLTNKKDGFTTLSIIGGSANAELKFGNPTITNTTVNIKKGLSPKTTITYVSGDNPNFYNYNIGDYLTIESLLLSGVFEIIAIGYDFVTINTKIDAINSDVSATVLLQINREYRITDKNSYTTASEATIYNEVVFTIPAIAPIFVDSYVPYLFLESFKEIDVISYTSNSVTVDYDYTGDLILSLENSFFCTNPFKGVKSGNIITFDQVLPTTVFKKVNIKQLHIYKTYSIVLNFDHKHFLSTGSVVTLQNGLSGDYNVKYLSETSIEIPYDHTYISFNMYRISSTNQYGLLKIETYSQEDVSYFNKGDVINISSGPIDFVNKKMVVDFIDGNKIYVNFKYPASNKVLAEGIEISTIEKIDLSLLEYKINPQPYYNNLKVKTTISTITDLNSYIYTDNNKIARSISGVLNKTVFSNTHAILEISTDKVFPIKGEVVVDYGSTSQETLQYVNKYMDNGKTFLEVKPNYLLKRDHKKGESVLLVSEDNTRYLEPHVNSVADKQKECERIIKQVVSAGVESTFDVIYPEYVNEDESIKILE